jgi:hypothetical protein
MLLFKHRLSLLVDSWKMCLYWRLNTVSYKLEGISIKCSVKRLPTLSNQVYFSLRHANCIVYGELGRVPMSVSVKARMIGFWERILTGKREKISQTVYDIVYKFDVADFFIPNSSAVLQIF